MNTEQEGDNPMPAMDYSKVADLYDVYVRTDIDVPFFIEEARGRRNALELTCGTGRLSIPLIEAGVNLSCFDHSPEMLSILRDKLRAAGIDAPVYHMDMSDFSLPDRFDLVIIPLNSFAEITEPESQRSALAAIGAHLSENGRFICTLHNPTVRLRTVDGQVRVRNSAPLPDGGRLFLSTWENYDPDVRIVQGAQFYEIYGPEGVLRSKRFVDLKFFVHSRETFEDLADSQGFRIASFYGDYQRGAFDPERSPFMIWTLEKR